MNTSNQYNPHAHCLLCGTENPWSFKLSFQKGNNGYIYGKFQTHDKLQGYNGILHGGVISALLDSAMTHYLFSQNIQAVTGDLQVRFVHPIPCNDLINLRASLLTNKSPLYCVKAEIILDERIMAWSKAKFIQHKTT